MVRSAPQVGDDVVMATEVDPDWLVRLREASKQRPRTQFQRVRWADLQALLKEHALLMSAADVSTLRAVDALRQQ